MIASETRRELLRDEIGRRLVRWSGRELTGGPQTGLKMVTGHRAVEEEKNMAGVVEFASQIAHHFNNILSVMSGYGGLLKARMSGDDPSLTYVEKMLTSSLRARDLVRSLFLFTGDEKSRLREIDLNRVVKRTSRFLSHNEEEGIVTRMVLHDNSLFVMADVVKMEEVLVNLIENARDAMPHGGTLTISTEPVWPGEGSEGLACHGEPRYTCLSVIDTGTGMDEETRARMFDPFFTTKGPGRNMGLGLCKVYGIVKQHGGEIDVESVPGQGTSVKIRMPLVEAGLAVSEPIPLPDSVIAARVPLSSAPWRQ